MKRYKKSSSPAPGRLQDLSGNLVESTERANTFATYYEKVQWGSQWEALPPPPAIAPAKPPLPIHTGIFQVDELEQVLRKLRKGKAPGNDSILPDFWIALSSHPDAMMVLLHLLNKAWISKQIPNSWKKATVVTLIKKGSTALPENYRNIIVASCVQSICFTDPFTTAKRWR